VHLSIETDSWSGQSGVKGSLNNTPGERDQRHSRTPSTNPVQGETRHGVTRKLQKTMNSNPPVERTQSPPIASEKVAIDRKIFFLDLKENQRGRFLKITEDVGGRRDTIMLPAEAFKDFAEALERLIEFEGRL
jgi:hypothetical protein